MLSFASGGLGGTAYADPLAIPIKHCGDAARYVSVGSHDVSCKRARAVAHAYLHGNHHPYGLRCKEIPVNAAAGEYTHCTKGAAFVNVVPE